jgi:AraC family transcriptional regulator of adaptative response/methylated-DNA-[protein]-cysteine methyltransferase
VYCRPSCGARRANPDNVAFHVTAADAERQGFRPCKRCRPDEQSPDKRRVERIAAACRMIEAAGEPPALAALARTAGLSLYHFHRVFKAVTGLTPRSYAAAHRAGRVRHQLRRSPTVTHAIYDAGFNSGSRFYAESERILGMTPTEYRTGGPQAEIHFATGRCSLGFLLAATTCKGVCAILLGDDPAELARQLHDSFPSATLVVEDTKLDTILASVIRFVESPGTSLELPLDVRGTAFQQRVWQAIRRIPAGATLSYSDLSQRIGAPSSVRAVARACGSNPLAVAVPCHRVVARDGALAGYRWGLERKRELLDREARGAAAGGRRRRTS